MTTTSSVLQGRCAIVTGAGSGIGRAVALGYAQAGAAVACVSRNEARLRETVAAIEALGGRGLALPADVCNFDALQACCGAAQQAFGHIDLVFGAAGQPSPSLPVEQVDPADFRRAIEVNLVGALHTAKAVIPLLKRSGGGALIFVGSGMGHRAMAGRSAYATSKAGVHMLVRVLAQELMGDRICVNELVPGLVNTDFIAGRVEQLKQAAGPGEWFKEPEDVLPLALYMATQPLPGPTGQTFSLARREL